MSENMYAHYLLQDILKNIYIFLSCSTLKNFQNQIILHYFLFKEDLQPSNVLLYQRSFTNNLL